MFIFAVICSAILGVVARPVLQHTWDVFSNRWSKNTATRLQAMNGVGKSLWRMIVSSIIAISCLVVIIIAGIQSNNQINTINTKLDKIITILETNVTSNNITVK